MDTNSIMLIIGIIVLIVLIITIPCCCCKRKPWLYNKESFALANMKQMAAAYRNNCNLDSQAYLIGLDGNVRNDCLHTKANWPVDNLKNFPNCCPSDNGLQVEPIKHEAVTALNVMNGSSEPASQNTVVEKFDVNQGQQNVKTVAPKGASAAYLSGMGSRQFASPSNPPLSIGGKTVNRNGNPDGGWTNNTNNNRAQLLYNGKGVSVAAVNFRVDDSKMSQQGSLNTPVERFGCSNSRLNPLTDLSSITGVTDVPNTVDLPDNEFNPSVWECQNGKPVVVK